MVDRKYQDFQWQRADTGPPDLIIQSDASKKGGGARCQRQSTRGARISQEIQYHKNILELTAAKVAFQTYYRYRKDLRVHVQVDKKLLLPT